MLAWPGRYAAFGLLIGMLATIFSLLTSAAAGPAAQSGIFVNIGADARGAALTMQTQQHLVTLRLSANVAVQERAAAGPPQNVRLTALKAGEPVALFFGRSGDVSRIEARYWPVSARLVVAAHGYIVTTTGATYKLVGDAASSGAGLPLGIYLLLRTDPQSGSAFDLVASRSPIADTGGGRKTAVTFVVRVPANTPAADAVYLATNAQNWTPNGIRMAPASGNRWTTTIVLSSGSLLEYKYTRGSWSTDERNAAGSEISNRSLTVSTGSDAQTVNDSVSRWADLTS